MWAFEVWQEGLRVASGVAPTEEEARSQAAQYEGAVHIDFKANRLNNLKGQKDEVLYLQRNVHRVRKQRLSCK